MATKKEKRLIEVWGNFVAWAKSHDYLDEMKERLNDWLDELHGNDSFGTEGQSDPRGDCRELHPEI